MKKAIVMLLCALMTVSNVAFMPAKTQRALTASEIDTQNTSIKDEDVINEGFDFGSEYIVLSNINWNWDIQTDSVTISRNERVWKNRADIEYSHAIDEDSKRTLIKDYYLPLSNERVTETIYELGYVDKFDTQDEYYRKESFLIDKFDGNICFVDANADGGSDVKYFSPDDEKNINILFSTPERIIDMFVVSQNGEEYMLYKSGNTIYARNSEGIVSSYDTKENDHVIHFVPTSKGIITYYLESENIITSKQPVTILNKDASEVVIDRIEYDFRAFDHYDFIMGDIKIDDKAKTMIYKLSDIPNAAGLIEPIGTLNDYKKAPSPRYDGFDVNYDESTKTLYISGEGEMLEGFSYSIYGNGLYKNVENVVIGEGITSICTNAFYNYENLKRVSLPSTIKTIGYSAFSGCKYLEEINLPEGLERICEFAFANCDSLKTLNIPSTVKVIESYAFALTPWYDSLDDEFVIVGENVLIKYNGTSDNIEIPNGVKAVSDIFETRDGKHLKVTLPDTVKYIYGLTSWSNMADDIEIPSSVEEIGNRSLHSSKDVIEIPASVKKIGRLAFCGGDYAIYDRVIFRGEKPEVLYDEYDEPTYNLYEEQEYLEPRIDTIIYYDDAYADSWAPNGETIWEEMRCEIRPLSSIEPKMKGDVDGDGTISSADATMILRYVARLTKFMESQTKAALLTGETVSTSDATKILRIVAGLEK